MRLIIALLGFLLLFGCLVLEQKVEETPQQPPETPPEEEMPPVEEEQPVEAERPRPAPQLDILSPSPNEVIETDGPVALVVSVRNVELVPPGGPKKEGEGHLKIVVDGGEPMYTTSLTNSLSLSEGPHTVMVELVHNDGSSYSPPVRDQVSFSVRMPMEEEERPVAAKEISVTEDGLEFSVLEARVGDSITFVNTGTTPVSVVAIDDEGVLFNTGALHPGESATVTIERAGTFTLASPFRPQIKGTLTVSE